MLPSIFFNTPAPNWTTRLQVKTKHNSGKNLENIIKVTKFLFTKNIDVAITFLDPRNRFRYSY